MKASFLVEPQLVVVPQEVIPGQAKSGDWWFLAKASMGPVPVVAVDPSSQVGAAVV